MTTPAVNENSVAQFDEDPRVQQARHQLKIARDIVEGDDEQLSTAGKLLRDVLAAYDDLMEQHVQRANRLDQAAAVLRAPTDWSEDYSPNWIRLTRGPLEIVISRYGGGARLYAPMRTTTDGLSLSTAVAHVEISEELGNEEMIALALERLAGPIISHTPKDAT